MIRIIFDLLVYVFDSDDYDNHHNWSENKKNLFLEQTQNMFESFEIILKITIPFIIYFLIKDAELQNDLKEFIRVIVYYSPVILMWSIPGMFIFACIHDVFFYWDAHEGRHKIRTKK